MGKAIAMGRTRHVATPWLTITNGDWTWKVLKAYTEDPDAKYARWMCAVTSPYTGSLGDWGDTYISEVRGFVTQQDPSVPDEALPRHLRNNKAKSVTQIKPGLTVIHVGD